MCQLIQDEICSDSHKISKFNSNIAQLHKLFYGDQLVGCDARVVARWRQGIPSVITSLHLLTNIINTIGVSNLSLLLTMIFNTSSLMPATKDVGGKAMDTFNLESD